MSWFEVAQREPGTPALVDGTQSITFGELRSVVARIAASWDEAGVPRGGSVAVVLPNCSELLAIELAALSTERYFVPVNRHLTAPEIAYILGNCGPSLVVTNDELLPVVEAAAAGIRVFTTGPGFERAWAHLPDADPRDRRAGSVTYYSSGTTGRPKGVHRALSGATPEQDVELSRATWPLLGLTPGPGIHVAVAPLYHPAPNSMVLGALARGVTVTFAPGGRFDASRFLRFAGESGMTESFLVPTMFVRLLQLPGEERAAFDPGRLRAVVHAGAPCPPPVKHRMIEWWGPVLEEFYGSTESAVTTTVHSREWLEAPGTVGRARPGYTIEIRDAAGAPVPAGAEGLIHISGSPPFEYLGDPGKTRDSRSGDALVLGDVGRLDEQGRLFVLDRRTDLILSGGVNVYPAEVESALLGHPLVVDLAVVGLPDDEWGQRVVAVVQPAAGADRAALPGELAAYTEARLAKFKRPREYRVVAEIPRMATGKVNRSALRAQVLRELA
ncbi:AMP-binding protein [Amycolatopsis jejuensis]|uniref:AMP-binding protein n=1 Tax=Amycolatopsis jejuensis TaxID=330084 RepID=UPI000527F71A|nr:AMP-binding protein [Amycolatopsis jejuensis]